MQFSLAMRLGGGRGRTPGGSRTVRVPELRLWGPVTQESVRPFRCHHAAITYVTGSTELLHSLPPTQALTSRVSGRPICVTCQELQRLVQRFESSEVAAFVAEVTPEH